MNFFIWLVTLIGAYILQPNIVIFVWILGIVYFIGYIFLNNTTKIYLKSGTWVKSVSQVNNITQIVITDGANDSIQKFKSSNVSITGNVITIG